MLAASGDMKESLGMLGNDLVVRVRWVKEVVAEILQDTDSMDGDGGGRVVGVWKTRYHGSEEVSGERGVKSSVEKIGDGRIEFRVFEDES